MKVNREKLLEALKSFSSEYIYLLDPYTCKEVGILTILGEDRKIEKIDLEIWEDKEIKWHIS